MKIGDKIKIKRKRNKGEVFYSKENSTRTATVVAKYKNFVVVQYEKRI